MPSNQTSPRAGIAALKAETGLSALPSTPQQQISALLKNELPRIQRLLQNPAMTKRFAQLAMHEMNKNPTLFECVPSTVLGCLMTAASLGLQLGVGGQAYLIPYRSRGQMICTFVPGWKGLMALMHRSGEAEAQAEVVREGDLFRYSLGTDPYIEHERRGDDDRRATHYYAWGRTQNAKYPVVRVMTVGDVERHLSKFNKVGGMHYALKDNRVNFDMYGMKVPLLQVLKYLPATFELDVAMDMDGQADSGRQRIEPDNVIEGVIPTMPVEPEPDDSEIPDRAEPPTDSDYGPDE